MQSKAPLHALLASLLLFFLCLGGTAWLASKHGVQHAERRAAELAAGVMSVVENVADQVDSAMQGAALNVEGVQACSDADIARLRTLPPSYYYVSAIARLNKSGDRVLCSTLGPQADGLLLGAPDHLNGDARRVHRRAAMPMTGTANLVVSEGGLAVFVHSGIASSILSTLHDASLGAYLRGGGPVIFSRGVYDFAALKRLEQSGHSADFLNDRLMGISISSKEEFVAFVSFPSARVNAAIEDSRALLLPLGGVVGLTLSVVFFFLLRHLTSMPASLVRALNTDRVYMEYQPIVDLRTGCCIGAEALVRWKRGGRLIPPDRFIAAAEHAGIMPIVTRRIVDLVAWDTAEFLRVHPDFHVSLNFSTLDLRAERTVDMLAGLLRVTGLPARSFWIEMTETGFVEEDVSQTIELIRAMGIRVAVDDFGTGYSNLGVLNDIKVDLLKIDKRFVDRIDASAQGAGVITAIIGLANSLGLELVAEGVETQHQADFLLRSGVQFAQGWLFGKPGPLSALLADEIANTTGKLPP